MQYGMMPGSSRDCRILLENRGDTIERSERRIGNRISDTIIGTCPAPFAPHKIVLTVLLEHERTFHISIRCHFLVDRPVFKRNQPGEIVVQANDITMSPTAVIHIVAAIIVTENELVDRLCPVYDLVDKRFA